MRPSLLIAIVLALWSLFAVQAFACSCVRAGTVDEEFAKTPNVVILKLRSVEKYAQGEKGYGYGGIKRSILTVEKVYKGTLKVGDELVFAQGGGADCVWTFDPESIGTEFLLYLRNKAKPSDLWMAFTCSRSSSIAGAAADILYLENLKKVAGRTRLSGRITKRLDSATEEQKGSFEFLPNIKVTVTGNGKTFRPKTDMNGVFEIYDLPPGKYHVEPEPITGFKFEADNDVRIDPKAHEELDFDFIVDDAIRGRVFDAQGKPLKDVCLKLVPARGTPARYFYGGDCTNPDGSFEFEEVPPGAYVILVNDDDKVTAEAPFGAFYYPNVKKREDAAEVQVSPGTVIENLSIVAPETADVVTVTGVLKLADGKTANDDNAEYAAIEFRANSSDPKPDDKPTSRVDINNNGRFRIRILKGQKGELYGTIRVFSGLYENCPAVEKFIKESGIGVPEIKTPSVPIVADQDQTDIELKFPFPSCKIDKSDPD